MKKRFLLIIAILIQVPLWSQDTIRISPDLELIKISDNAFIHVSYANLPGYGRASANGLIYINKRRAFLFDTPWNDSLTETLVTFLEDNRKVRITGFVPNHWHEDCMGGLKYLQGRKIRSYANRLTQEIAREKGLPVPDTGFSDSLSLSLGRKTILCYFPGPAHSMDNIVVWIPSEKILFPGCTCKSIEAANLGNTSDGDTNNYRATVDRIMTRFADAVFVIPGHGSFGGQELLEKTKSLTAGR